MRWLRSVAVALAALVVAGAAQASVTVAFDAQRASLRVDAHGVAEVSWTAGGSRHTLLVPASGSLVPGGRLTGPDVSKAASGPALPYLKVLRRTPDGRLWALQAWQVHPGSPIELHLSRWSGAAPTLSLHIEGERLVGQATFQGRPVQGFSPTPEGKRVRITAYVDCFGCPGAPGWGRLLGVAPRADGSFRILLSPRWSGRSYRATLAGPNLGATLAPDAFATAAR